MNIIALLLSIILGGIVGYLTKKKMVDIKLKQLALAEQKIENAEKEALKIRGNAEKEAENYKKELNLKAKEEVYNLKEEAEKEIKNTKLEISKKEQRLIKKEENLDKKMDKLELKEKSLEEKEENLDKKENEIEEIILKQEKELERISELTMEEAKEILLSKLKDEIVHESAVAIRDYENNLELEKEKLAKRVISTAISKAASDYVVESTISVVQLPNDEMKGRIIGREGRNIRAIEALTGVDVIIDDTPEAVVLSCFDGVRREVAKLTIEKLVSDGRIHPAKIEETVKKSEKEIEKNMIEAGEQALLELGIHDISPEVIKTLGRLKYRTSYGQNVLMHSIEVAHIAATLASELGADVELAKRSGLLHDIGKALDHSQDGSHAILGAEFLKKYKEKDLVINAVGAHHGEMEFKSVEAVLVQACDAISASRPGARRETLSTYLKRLENLEEIANSFEGVESSYAIQAGREIRLIVNPDTINDDKALVMSREVAKQIEESMQYPGQIKVMVIRETRSVEYAK